MMIYVMMRHLYYHDGMKYKKILNDVYYSIKKTKGGVYVLEQFTSFFLKKETP